MTPIDSRLSDIDVFDGLADAPADLLPDTFSERLYGMLAPLARTDPDNAWSLLLYINAIGEMFQLVEDLVRDTPDGPGWSVLLDLDRCPVEALPWLGQFVGVRIPTGMSEADQRVRIAQTDGFKRGTRNALIGAASATLTDPKTVIFRERDHDPSDTPDYAYYLSVYTYDTQTPNPAATRAALLAQKPAGIVLNYVTITGHDYISVVALHATYASLVTAFADYTALLLND